LLRGIPQDDAPDVVYTYTPPGDMSVVITTCGSSFDTKLLLSTNLSDPTTYACNDDDRDCTGNTANSRLDATLKVGGAHKAWHVCLQWEYM
jgi:hypothetical protein